jgi:hypothetical protein
MPRLMCVMMCSIVMNTHHQTKSASLTRAFQCRSIVMNAHRINRGEFPDLKRGPNSDFFLIEEDNPTKILKLVTDLCTQRLPKHYNVDPITDIQVGFPVMMPTLVIVREGVWGRV